MFPDRPSGMSPAYAARGELSVRRQTRRVAQWRGKVFHRRIAKEQPFRRLSASHRAVRMVNGSDGSSTKKMQRHAPAMARPAMLAQIQSLPGAQRQLSANQRDRQRYAGKDRLQVRRHVVRTFIIVGITIVFRCKTGKPADDIAPHFMRRVFLNGQGGRGMAAEHGQLAGGHALFASPAHHVASDLVQPLARGGNDDLGGRLAHAAFMAAIPVRPSAKPSFLSESHGHLTRNTIVAAGLTRGWALLPAHPRDKKAGSRVKPGMTMGSR